MSPRLRWATSDDVDLVVASSALATYRSTGPSGVTPGLIAEWDLTSPESDR